MRKLAICAITLAMVGCTSEYEKSEVTVRAKEGRDVYTVEGDPISGAVISRESDGSIKTHEPVEDGFLHGEFIANRKGQPFIKSNYEAGRLTGSYEKFCENGNHEVKRNVISWPESYSEETFSCETGNQLTKTNMVSGKPVSEQITWVETDNKQVMVSQLNYNEKGELHGKSTWFTPQGQPSKLAQYQNGVLDGEYVEYERETGGPKVQGLYKEGKKVGQWLTAYGLRIADQSLLNTDDVRNQVLVSLGVESSSPAYNVGYAADRPYRTDLEKAQFYVDQGKVDFKKPYSFNFNATRLEILISERDGQELYKFRPLTNLVHENTLDWVLERGGDVNAIDYEGKNRLMLCIEHFTDSGCTIPHITKLLELTDIKAVDLTGRTALHMACRVEKGNKNEQSDLRKTILEKGEVNVQDKYGWTPLHYCLSNDYIEEAKQLIARGADVEIKDIKDVSAVQMVWLTTNPESYGSNYQASWAQARQDLAVQLHGAGKLSYHTVLPAFDESIRDLAMKNGNVELVKKIDSLEPI